MLIVWHIELLVDDERVERVETLEKEVDTVMEVRRVVVVVVEERRRIGGRGEDKLHTRDYVL